MKFGGGEVISNKMKILINSAKVAEINKKWKRIIGGSFYKHLL